MSSNCSFLPELKFWTENAGRTSSRLFTSAESRLMCGDYAVKRVEDTMLWRFSLDDLWLMSP
jgi:hypothetical protein